MCKNIHFGVAYYRNFTVHSSLAHLSVKQSTTIRTLFSEKLGTNNTSYLQVTVEVHFCDIPVITEKPFQFVLSI